MTGERMKVRGIPYVELCTGDPAAMIEYFRDGMGFTATPVAGSGPDRESTLLRHGGIRLLVSSPTSGHGAVAEYVDRHGEGVADIAFGVSDAAAAYETAVGRGARPVCAPALRR